MPGSTLHPGPETPTIEEQFSGFDNTSELPTIDEASLETAIEESGLASDETAEIDLADLDLGVDDLAETELASLDDLDVTGTNEVLDEVIDVTGRNPQVDPDATGVQSAMRILVAEFMPDINRKPGGYACDRGKTKNGPCAEVLGGRIGCRPDQADEVQWNNDVGQTAIIEILLQLRDDCFRWTTRVLAKYPVQDWSNDIVQ